VCELDSIAALAITNLIFAASELGHSVHLQSFLVQVSARDPAGCAIPRGRRVGIYHRTIRFMAIVQSSKHTRFRLSSRSLPGLRQVEA
jgi:hypothetical protein